MNYCLFAPIGSTCGRFNLGAFGTTSAPIFSAGFMAFCAQVSVARHTRARKFWERSAIKCAAVTPVQSPAKKLFETF